MVGGWPAQAETERLALRLPRLSDAPALLAVFGDAEAMRFTVHLATLRQVRRHLAAHDRLRRRLGYGLWTVLARTSGEIVGLGGLNEDPFDPGWGPEIAYHFAPSVWGRGYATELTAFSLDVAHARLGLAEVRAFAHPDDAASLRVLAKAGFEDEGLVRSMNRRLFVHRVAD